MVQKPPSDQSDPSRACCQLAPNRDNRASQPFDNRSMSRSRMAEFLTTRHTTYRIEEIIAKARRRIVLVSPFVHFPSRLFDRLEDSSRRGVSITLVFGKRELTSEECRRVSSLRNLRLFYCRDLHAKCYFNEAQLVITSLNLLESSERNNWEMGVAVSATEQIYAEAVAEAESIIRHSVAVEPTRASHYKGQAPAYCISCRGPIGVPDTSAPYCYTCFNELPDRDDVDRLEHYCHFCGEQWTTSRRRPLCGTCWRENR